MHRTLFHMFSSILVLLAVHRHLAAQCVRVCFSFSLFFLFSSLALIRIHTVLCSRRRRRRRFSHPHSFSTMYISSYLFFIVSNARRSFIVCVFFFFFVLFCVFLLNHCCVVCVFCCCGLFFSVCLEHCVIINFFSVFKFDFLVSILFERRKSSIHWFEKLRIWSRFQLQFRFSYTHSPSLSLSGKWNYNYFFFGNQWAILVSTIVYFVCVYFFYYHKFELAQISAVVNRFFFCAVILQKKDSYWPPFSILNLNKKKPKQSK